MLESWGEKQKLVRRHLGPCICCEYLRTVCVLTYMCGRTGVDCGCVWVVCILCLRVLCVRVCCCEVGTVWVLVHCECVWGLGMSVETECVRV